MILAIADKCVYTIVAPERLRSGALTREPFVENERWTTARFLLQEAKENGELLAIVFGDARNTQRLLAWSTIDKLRVMARSTKYFVSELYDLSGIQRKELLVLSTDKPIPRSYIRSYVLCATPSSLLQRGRNPVRWSVMRSLANDDEGSEFHSAM